MNHLNKEAMMYVRQGMRELENTLTDLSDCFEQASCQGHHAESNTLSVVGQILKTLSFKSIKLNSVLNGENSDISKKDNEREEELREFIGIIIKSLGFIDHNSVPTKKRVLDLSLKMRSKL